MATLKVPVTSSDHIQGPLNAPIALIEGPKLKKVIESVAVFVDSQGLAVVPAPKKLVVSAAAV